MAMISSCAHKPKVMKNCKPVPDDVWVCEEI